MSVPKVDTSTHSNPTGESEQSAGTTPASSRTTATADGTMQRVITWIAMGAIVFVVSKVFTLDARVAKLEAAVGTVSSSGIGDSMSSRVSNASVLTLDSVLRTANPTSEVSARQDLGTRMKTVEDELAKARQDLVALGHRLDTEYTTSARLRSEFYELFSSTVRLSLENRIFLNRGEDRNVTVELLDDWILTGGGFDANKNDLVTVASRPSGNNDGRIRWQTETPTGSTRTSFAVGCRVVASPMPHQR